MEALANLVPMIELDQLVQNLLYQPVIKFALDEKLSLALRGDLHIRYSPGSVDAKNT